MHPLLKELRKGNPDPDVAFALAEKLVKNRDALADMLERITKPARPGDCFDGVLAMLTEAREQLAEMEA